MKVQILSLPNSTATPFQTSANAAAPPPASIYIGTGLLFLISIIFACHAKYAYQVIHPAGNVAEHLVASGLARVVDWHAGMLASNGGMERLRTAEKSAKERRLCLYANIHTTASIGKSNGASSTGHTQTFDATVVRVWSGDQVSVVEKDTNKERRMQLSSTRGPK